MIDIDPSATALLLLDFQNYGIHPDGYSLETLALVGTVITVDELVAALGLQ